MSGHGQDDISRMTKNVVHELGHAFNNSLAYPDPDHPGQNRRPDNDMPAAYTRDILRPNQTSGGRQRWEWQQSPSNESNEVFADIFLAWTYNAWNTNTDPQNVAAVNAAQGFMNGLVP